MDLLNLAPPAFNALIRLGYRIFNQKLPGRIQVKTEAAVSFFQVVDYRVEVNFDGQSVSRVSQITAGIRNRANEAIKDIKLKFTFPDDVLILQCELDGVHGASDDGPKHSIENPQVPSQALKDGSERTAACLLVHIPYLNAALFHDEVVLVKMLCSGNPEPYEVSGRGDGWTVEFYTIESLENAIQNWLKVLCFFPAFNLGCLLLLWILDSWHWICAVMAVVSLVDLYLTYRSARSPGSRPVDNQQKPKV
jgi:hypothetical protein